MLRLLPLVLCSLLCACRYNFIPVIPAPVPLSLPLRITQATLQRQGDELVIRARVDGPMPGDYLSAVWFAGDQELGRDSRYLDADHRSAEFHFPAPQKADYRALLLYGGTLLRQLDLREVDSLK
ncbi:hypothetical protein DKM44_08975 [Deinococcus irradiatisoli]|uniref:Uncharacterized protein n=1 Tax=Deinococcus irradiatisoli TaxID=2202254 RepID=A0A2Z3JVW5_9DEIO|nr:hypothetical protein [Deinococcus irradiatisoli]AWN24584.1 hypothetical protein DKM44_08975 [Deinococcus irradiatisoli]